MKGGLVLPSGQFLIAANLNVEMADVEMADVEMADVEMADVEMADVEMAEGVAFLL